MAPSDLLSNLLREVSRSFYLTLRVLPESVRPQVGLAYLLARMTDTIADTSLVPLERRLSALRQLRARILGPSAAPLDFSEFTRVDADAEPPIARGGGAFQSEAPSAAERRLLTRVEQAVDALDRLSLFDREQLRAVLGTITSGQELDLVRFAESSPDHLVALATDQELDDYTYRVAGCVGEFWTHMCRAHVFPEAALDDEFLLHAGVRFGKGLQLVNVLRDLPRDVARGRCYLPWQGLSSVGLRPADLPNPASQAAFSHLLQRYLDVAAAHLAAGWAYTNALPRRAVRVRLACAWPILIGLRTLGRLRGVSLLGSRTPAKVPRSEVRQVLLQTILFYPWPRLWRGLFTQGARSSENVKAP